MCGRCHPAQFLAGGERHFPHRIKRGEVMSVAQTFERWIAIDQCDTTRNRLHSSLRQSCESRSSRARRRPTLPGPSKSSSHFRTLCEVPMSDLSMNLMLAEQAVKYVATIMSKGPGAFNRPESVVH